MKAVNKLRRWLLSRLGLSEELNVAIDFAQDPLTVGEVLGVFECERFVLQQLHARSEPMVAEVTCRWLTSAWEATEKLTAGC